MKRRIPRLPIRSVPQELYGRAGRWSAACNVSAWTLEAKNPFSPVAPEPFPTVPLQRDSVGGQLEAARGVLPVSDRAAGPGWRRPLPHEGELGADCAQDKPLRLQQLGRAVQVERISGLAGKPLVHKNAGRHWSPLGRALATGTRWCWWRWPPSGGVQPVVDASALARPPGRALWSKDLEDCWGNALAGRQWMGSCTHHALPG